MPLFELPDGSPVPIDWSSADEWSKHGLSPVTEGVLDRRSGDDLTRLERRASAAEASFDGDDIGLLPIAPTLTPTNSTLAQLNGESPLRPNKSSSRLATALRPLRQKLGSDKPSPAAVVEATGPPSDREVIDYLKRTLARASRFWSELTELHDGSRSYPPIVLITSDATATVRGALVDSPDDVRSVDFSRLLYAEGDGSASTTIDQR